MAEPGVARPWRGRLAFAGLALVIVFAQLLPLDTVPRTWAAPDVLLAATLAWAIRRPDLLPVLMVAGLWFLTDLLFHRPPGLMAALVVLSVEFLRSRGQGLNGASFGVEWIAASAMIAGITLANRVILGIVMTPQAPLSLSLIQMMMTILCYPFLVGLALVLFGLRHPAPGDGVLDGPGR